MTLTRTFQDATTHDHRSELELTGSVHERALVFFSRGGIEMVNVRPGQSVVIGRGEPADVCLKDASLSRRHAEVRNEAGKLWVRDLGSRNGTVVHGEQITAEVEVHPGDEVRLGGVVAQVRAAASRTYARGMDTPEQFLSRLEEEVVRARTFGRPLCLLMLRGGDSERGRVRQWSADVRQALRPVDRMTPYGSSAALVLLPEMGATEARAVATSLVVQSAQGARLRCALAAYPEAGQTHDQLLTAVHDLARRATSAEPLLLADQSASPGTGDALDVVVESPRMKRLHELVARAAPTDAPVLVLGETGVGKEIVATTLHQKSLRKDGPLRIVNCAALPATLTESLLFGHERGAFTGADRRTQGVFEQANGGTVFLDEVGELSPSAQAALLRILENRKFSRVGSADELDANVRIVAATHRDLEAMMRASLFRTDLFYRLNTLTLLVPPLRERPEEIAPLAERFLQRASRDWNVAVRSLHPDALQLLKSYDWPGNVRELRNAVERGVIVGGGPELQVQDLPENIRARAAQTGISQPPPLVTGMATPVAPLEVELAGDEERAGAHAAAAMSYRDRVKTYEAAVITEALKRHGGSRKRTARALKIPLRTLLTKIKSLDIKA